MSIGLFDNVGKSFKFAFNNTCKKFLRWIGLAILMYIPIVSIFADGIILKIYRDEEPSFANPGKSIIQGLLLFVINIIYLIIPFIVLLITMGPILIPAVTSPSAATANAVLSIWFTIGLLITLVVTVFFSLILVPAMVNFARKESFGAAFAFGDIFGMIRRLGVDKYILAWLVLFAVAIVYVLIVSACNLVSPILGEIIVFAVYPIFQMFYAKYFSNLFE